MKTIFLVLSLCMMVSHAFSQQSKKENKTKPKKYVAIFDKLADDFTFKEVKYTRGKEKEVTISKPKLKYGDILIIRAINTNEFVFDMEIEKSYLNATTTSGFSQTIGSLTGLLSGVGSGKLFSAAGLLGDHLGYSKPDPISRGVLGAESTELSKAEALEFEYASNKHLISSYFKGIQLNLNSISDGVSLLLNESMTKNELQLAYNQFINDFNMHEMLNDIDEVNNLIENIELDIDNFRSQPFWDEPLEEEFLDIQHSLQKTTSLIEEQGITRYHLMDKEEELKQMDFILENRFLIDDEVLSSDNSFQDFLITFNEKSDEGGGDEYEYEFDESSNDDLTKMTRLLSFPVVGAHLPIWTTGVTFVAPFSGVNEFNIQENDFYDSIYVSMVQNKRLIFSIGTNLMYEFLTEKALIPNVNAGIALGILENDDRKFSFTIGGGVRLRDFPALSINAGIAFIENQRLRDTFGLNKWISSNDVPINEDYQPDLFKRGFSPGYFFGLNIHF